MEYNKFWTDIDSQIQKLRKRGMIIEDKALAEYYLMNVGYYRLVGYWWPLQADKRTHFFKSGSKFENAIGLWINNLPTGREQHFLYLQLCCMKYLLNSISPDNHFTEKLGALLCKYPGVDPGAMGIKCNWMDEPLWVNNSIKNI